MRSNVVLNVHQFRGASTPLSLRRGEGSGTEKRRALGCIWRGYWGHGVSARGPRHGRPVRRLVHDPIEALQSPPASAAVRSPVLGRRGRRVLPRAGIGRAPSSSSRHRHRGQRIGSRLPCSAAQEVRQQIHREQHPCARSIRVADAGELALRGEPTDRRSITLQHCGCFFAGQQLERFGGCWGVGYVVSVVNRQGATPLRTWRHRLTIANDRQPRVDDFGGVRGSSDWFVLAGVAGHRLARSRVRDDRAALVEQRARSR